MSQHKNKIILSGMEILYESTWKQNHALVIENDVFKALIPNDDIRHHDPFQHYHFSKQYKLIPGLIDCHIHGINGHDVMDASLTAYQEMSLALAREGVTHFLATTMTAKQDEIEKVVLAINQHHKQLPGAKIAGIHLEGPFLSPKKSGAQQKELLLNPSWALFSDWQKKSGQLIKMVTLAPELPNALDVIKNISQSNVIVSIGHTAATFDETMAGIDAGCTHATHLFNAMSPLHHREPGAIGAILLSHLITAELIADGIHFHPALAEIALKMKGQHHLILVSDAIRATCMADGSYNLGGQEVRVVKQRACLADGTLAGSVLRMPQAIKNMVAFSGCRLEEAIAMASANPARLLALSQTKGSIRIGNSADCVVMDQDFKPVLTLCEGKEIFIAKKS